MVSNEAEPADTRTWRSYFPDGDLWVFGYGSLIWKPPPHFDQRVPGYINGYVRRFWQVKPTTKHRHRGLPTLTSLSSDHRGTVDSPGRVVTVIEREFWETLDDPLAHEETSTAAASRVWGTAYHIPASHASEVHDYLDEREINGYSVHYTPFHSFSQQPGKGAEVPASAPITCMVYIGQPSNSQFLREKERREPSDVAEVISRSSGKSGKNTEYLYLLEKALEGIGLGSVDGHVTDLVRRVKAIESDEAVVKEEKAAERDLQRSLSRSVEVESS